MKKLFYRAIGGAGVLALSACGGGSNETAVQSSVGSSINSSAALSSIASSQTSSGVVNFAKGFALGADISWISEMEANGYKFYNREGEPKDAFVLMSDLGLDAIRLRVWVNPADGWYNSIQDVIVKAKRAKAQGQRIMVDFHYSDSWADPGKQTKPALWVNYTIDELKVALTTHTRNSLIALRDEGITPEWVQVGNETNDGFLWDFARPSKEPKATTMKNYAELTTAGYDAVKDVFPNALVIVHLANCHNNDNFRWIFDGLKANGGKFDVIGASSYPTTDTVLGWQTITKSCADNLDDMVVRYQVPVMLTEVGVPWDHPDGKTIIADLIAKVAAVKNSQGLGVLYWEPQAYNWKGYSLGAFDTSGKPGGAMDAFTEAAVQIPK